MRRYVWSTTCRTLGHSPRMAAITKPDVMASPARGDGKLHGDAMKYRATFLGIFLILAAIHPVGAGERLTMRVSPAVSFAPANLIVRAFIEAHNENRAVAIIAESQDFYRSSEVQLDGEN